MAYDQAHGKVIMFGGLSEWRAPPLDDLWVLDPAERTWREVSSEPIITEEEDTGPEQTGIPGFPFPSILIGLILITFILGIGKPPKTFPV
jgi:hypothetical protein